MDPKIEYATTADGFSLAYWAMGEGPPLVVLPPAFPWSHIGLEPQIPEWQHWYEHLARQCRVVRYDGRGSGLSDREVDTLSLEAYARDLETVVDDLGLERFGLFGLFFSGPVAIAYAAKHPDRVSHLVLWCSFAKASDCNRAGQQQEALDRLMELDWDLFTETLAHTVFGWSEGDQAHRIAQYMRASVTPELMRRTWGVNDSLNIDLTGGLTCPTLVMHRRQFPIVPVSVARDLASSIPGARLAMLEGESVAPYSGDMESVLRTLVEFVGGDPSMIEHAAHASTAGAFRTIMFTDMEGSTATTQRMGDAQAQELVRVHNQIVRDALHSHGGTEVKHTGDGIMASFAATSLALESAIAIQQGLAMHSMLHPDHPRFNVRIGLNAGEPVIEGDDLFGTAVQLASRVCTRAEPQQILVSDVVRQVVAGKGFLFSDRGETELRGFEDPVRLFEVHWRESTS